MNIYIFIKMKISGNCEMWKRRGASHFFGLLQMRIKKPGFPGFRVMIKAKLPDALRLSGLHVSCNILNSQVFVGRIRRSRRIRHDKAHIDICLSPALRGFFRQKQGDADEKSVIYLAKLCFIVYPCQTARHKAAECISPF